MSVASGAAELLTDAVRAGAEAVLGALSDPSADRGREDWLALAARVPDAREHRDRGAGRRRRRGGPTRGCVVRGRQRWARSCTRSGRVTLDAADLVAPSLGATHAQAQRRVEQAVRLADGLDPVEADSTHVPEASGLRGLHLAMAGGRLDGYRAAVVAHELDLVPARRRRGGRVVARRTPHRRRAHPAPPHASDARAHLARPAEAARRTRPGVHGVAAMGLGAWGRRVVRHVPERGCRAGVGRRRPPRARPRRRGHVYSVEQARARALTEIISGNATIDVQVVLTVPADAVSSAETVDVGSAETVDVGSAEDGRPRERGESCAAARRWSGRRHVC